MENLDTNQKVDLGRGERTTMNNFKIIERGEGWIELLFDQPGSKANVFTEQALTELGCDGVVAFGIVLQGATHHADLVAREAARGCMQVQLDTKKPVTFEVLYVNTLDDAKRRTTGKEAKGPLAAQTVLSCLAKQAELRP
jgi:6,7-dimethyl-8-ribityllumazine synthase